MPTFSAATKLVQVDVIARSKGAPATGLTKEDFTLFDNGKPRNTSFFSVRSPRTSGTASRPAAVPLPPGAVSNLLERDGGANATVLLIDQKNTVQTNRAFAIQRIVSFCRRARAETVSRSGSASIHSRETACLPFRSSLTMQNYSGRAANSLKARDPSYVDYDTKGMTQHAADDGQGRGYERSHVYGLAPLQRGRGDSVRRR